jgi:uncharacterized membrane protein
MKSPITLADWLVLLFWLAQWVGYVYWAERSSNHRPSLIGSIHPLRHLWMRNSLQRENRIADASLVGNLMQSSTFFSSTTLLILGGLVALLGTAEKGVNIVSSIPFAVRPTYEAVEFKTVVMLFVFVHAFIRFTWSLRQFNVVCIVIGALPARASPEQHKGTTAALVETGTRLSEIAGGHFTQGLRSYYYSVPVLLWYVNAWLFAAASLTITVAIYYMEFRSATVAALALHENEMNRADALVKTEE